MKRLKKTPTFNDEEAEREFWSTADSTEYVDWTKAEKLALPNFRSMLRTISLRLPESMLAELKLIANQRAVPYQSLIKVFLADRIKLERVTKGDRAASVWFTDEAGNQVKRIELNATDLANGITEFAVPKWQNNMIWPIWPSATKQSLDECLAGRAESATAGARQQSIPASLRNTFRPDPRCFRPAHIAGTSPSN